MPETQRGLGNATVGRREADVAGCAGRARLASVRSRLTGATNKVVRLPALRRPLISGPELQLTPRIRARARRSAGKCSGDAVETIRTMRQPGRRTCAAGTRCAARRMPRGGLFDIVKHDDGRAGV